MEQIDVYIRIFTDLATGVMTLAFAGFIFRVSKNGDSHHLLKPILGFLIAVLLLIMGLWLMTQSIHSLSQVFA